MSEYGGFDRPVLYCPSCGAIKIGDEDPARVCHVCERRMKLVIPAKKASRRRKGTAQH